MERCLAAMRADEAVSGRRARRVGIPELGKTRHATARQLKAEAAAEKKDSKQWTKCSKGKQPHMCTTYGRV